jgi:hypothetical protein
LWGKLRALRRLDPRTRTGSGFGPDAIVAQLIYSFVVGGASLTDAERLAEDSLALWALIREFVAWVEGRAVGAWWQYDGRAENFFDDT